MGLTAESRAALISIGFLLIVLVTLYGVGGGKILVGAPQQPIDFFHSVHVGQKHLACIFCHRTYATEAFAGMPSTMTCMRCHRVVIPEHPEIQRLHSYWINSEAIPWIRVNRLPGFVFFDHHAHIAKGVPCATCHGDVGKMDRLAQAAPLTMGWCVQCHRSKRAPIDCVTCHR
jgi:hypothetical protein